MLFHYQLLRFNSNACSAWSYRDLMLFHNRRFIGIIGRPPP